MELLPAVFSANAARAHHAWPRTTLALAPCSTRLDPERQREGGARQPPPSSEPNRPPTSPPAGGGVTGSGAVVVVVGAGAGVAVMSGGVAGAGMVRCWSIGSVVVPAGVPPTVTAPCTSTFANGGAGGAGAGSPCAGGGAPCGAKLAKNVFPGPDTNAVMTWVSSWQSWNGGIE